MHSVFIGLTVSLDQTGFENSVCKNNRYSHHNRESLCFDDNKK